MIAAAIRKECLLLLRDRGALASLFALPVLFILVFGSMFSGSGSQEMRRLAVFVEEATPRSEQAATALEASGLFAIERVASAEEARHRVVDERAFAALLLLRDFDPAAGHPAELAIDEAASPRVRLPVEGAIRGVLNRALLDAQDLPEVFVSRTPPGIAAPMAGASGFQVAVPGNAVLFGFFLALTVGLSFVEERKSGTFVRLRAAPARRSTLILAKLFPFLLIGLVQFAFLFGAGALFFGLDVSGAWLAVILLSAATVFCATSLGLLIASFSGTQKQVGGIGSIALLIMGLLGGSMFPRILMPPAMKSAGLMTPHAWALDGYYDVLVRSGTGVLDVAPQIGAVVAFGLAFAAIGALRFRFE